MFQVITVFLDGKIETDLAFDRFDEAVERQKAVASWDGQYGGITMVWNTAVKIRRKETGRA